MNQEASLRAKPEILWRYCPRIEPGIYPAMSRSAKVYFDRYFRRHVCAVQFDILNDALTDVIARLTWYLNLGSEQKPHAGRRSKFWAAWLKANGAAPKRTDRLSPRVFENRLARVLVVDTQHDFQQKIEPDAVYSVVRDVLEWETGSRP